MIKNYANFKNKNKNLTCSLVIDFLFNKSYFSVSAAVCIYKDHFNWATVQGSWRLLPGKGNFLIMLPLSHQVMPDGVMYEKISPNMFYGIPEIESIDTYRLKQ